MRLRLVFLAALSFTVITSHSQYSKDPNLNAIIKDAVYNFANTKGRFKEMFSVDSIYYSKIFIPGSKYSEVIVATDTKKTSFLATMDSATTKKTKKIVAYWKKYLTKNLDKQFKMEKVSYNWGSLGELTGYSFSNSGIIVDITYTTPKNLRIASKCYLGISLKE